MVVQSDSADGLATGASQAIEDGATIAKTLLLSKGSIKTATKVYEELRYKRVKETQLIGFQVRCAAPRCCIAEC